MSLLDSVPVYEKPIDSNYLKELGFNQINLVDFSGKNQPEFSLRDVWVKMIFDYHYDTHIRIDQFETPYRLAATNQILLVYDVFSKIFKSVDSDYSFTTISDLNGQISMKVIYRNIDSIDNIDNRFDLACALQIHENNRKS